MNGTTTFSQQLGAFDNDVPPRIAKPEWSLAGVVLDWPDDLPSLLNQSAWTPIEQGWTCVVTVPRGREDYVLFHTVFLIACSENVPPDLAKQRAKNLLWLRLRSIGPNPAVHLGDITI